jgi:hypothetical protein
LPVSDHLRENQLLREHHVLFLYAQ